MSEFRYTEDHEWARLDKDGNVTVGITHYAQEQLGDVVYVELPETGSKLVTGDEAAVVESVKAAGEVKSPIAGEVIAVNEQLVDEAELVNRSPLDDGWFFRLNPDDVGELESLMSESDYEEFVSTL